MEAALLALTALLDSDPDLRLVAVYAAGVPVVMAFAVVCLMLATRPPKDAAAAWEEAGRHHAGRHEDWRGGAHRAGKPRPRPGRHEPAKGRWSAAYVSRLGEDTAQIDRAPFASAGHVHEPYRDGVRIRCRVCKLDVPMPGWVHLGI